jgi:hypothetical protein
MKTTSDAIIRRDVPWREKSSAMRIFGALNSACWLISLASLVVLGGIETVAWNQPKQPIGVYQHPYQIKGNIRYLTDAQAKMGEIFHPALIVFFVLGGCAAAGYETARQRDYNRRKQAFFDTVNG